MELNHHLTIVTSLLALVVVVIVIDVTKMRGIRGIRLHKLYTQTIDVYGKCLILKTGILSVVLLSDKE